jgi:hypothetical protein
MFLVLGPSIFAAHVSLMSLSDEQVKVAEYYFAVTFWLPPVVSILWVALSAAKARRIVWPATLAFLKHHILFTQPTLALFVGSAIAAMASIRLESNMQNDEVMLMSLFSLIVFLLCAWFLPFALRPMLRLNGRSDQVTGMLANLIGLLLALMMAIVAFKAREKFGDVNAALNTLVDGVIAFLVAALAGAGAMLAAGKARAGRKQNDDESAQ